MSTIGARVLRTFAALQTYLVTATGTLFHVCDRGLTVTPLAIMLLHLRELGTLKFAIRFWWHPVSS
jgi:hypothetical protein